LLVLLVVVLDRDVLDFLEGGAVVAVAVVVAAVVAAGAEEEEVVVVSAAAEADPDDDEVALRLGPRPIQYSTVGSYDIHN
jgi:hypothetical protein